LESTIDVFLQARAEGCDAEKAVAIAEAAAATPPHRALDRQDLAREKGIRLSRQYLAELVRARRFPKPFLKQI
jgi:hypothetical protein